MAEVTLGQERRRNRLRHHRESTVCDPGGAGIQPAGTSATGCYGIEPGALVMEASSIATSSRRTSSLHPRFFERERTLQARTLHQLSLVRRFQTGGNLPRDGDGRRGQDSRLLAWRKMGVSAVSLLRLTRVREVPLSYFECRGAWQLALICRLPYRADALSPTPSVRPPEGFFVLSWARSTAFRQRVRP